MGGPSFEERLRAESLRLNDRFVQEVVEGLNLCPWARGARRNAEVRREVWLEALTDGGGAPGEGLCGLVAEIEADARALVTLVICPRASWPAARWTRFVERLRAEVLQPRGRAPVLAAAAFHPELPFSDERPATLVPLFRRSPDPTIQLVRLDVLHALAEKGDNQERYAGPEEIQAILSGSAPPPRPTVTARVTDANAQTLRRVGLDAVLAALDDIQQDRARTCAALEEAFGVGIALEEAPPPP